MEDTLVMWWDALKPLLYLLVGGMFAYVSDDRVLGIGVVVMALSIHMKISELQGQLMEKESGLWTSTRR